MHVKNNWSCQKQSSVHILQKLTINSRAMKWGTLCKLTKPYQTSINSLETCYLMVNQVCEQWRNIPNINHMILLWARRCEPCYQHVHPINTIISFYIKFEYDDIIVFKFLLLFCILSQFLLIPWLFLPLRISNITKTYSCVCLSNFSSLTWSIFWKLQKNFPAWRKKEPTSNWLKKSMYNQVLT